jgi:Fanconi-associated nuclease 1
VLIETAVAEALRSVGRNIMEAENGPWRTLFGLLFFEAVFAPVYGALPAPLLSRPLDLGTRDFKNRREAWIQPILQQIRDGEAGVRLKSAWEQHFGEGIAGVDWQRHSLDQLVVLCDGIGGPALSAIMTVFCEDWRGAGSGLPDLVVLPGPATRLPGLFPGKVTEGLSVVEIKGPTDSLRDEQRIWLDRLLHHGVRAEIWDVDGPETTPQRSG